jgi:hypothetical protein
LRHHHAGKQNDENHEARHQCVLIDRFHDGPPGIVIGCKQVPETRERSIGPSLAENAFSESQRYAGRSIGPWSNRSRLKPEIDAMRDVFARQRVRRSVGAQRVVAHRRLVFAEGAQPAQQP